MTETRKPAGASDRDGRDDLGRRPHSLDLYEYMDYGRRQEADELVARFPEVGAQADVIPVRFRAISSSAVSPKDWLALLFGEA